MGTLQQPRPYHSYRQPQKNGFWREITKRRVFPFLGLFLASGFLVLEGVDQLNGRGVVPEGIYWFTLILYLFGIPGTILLAWFHGERGPQRPKPIEYWLHGALVAGAIVTSFLVLPEFTSVRAGSLSAYRLAIDLPPDYPLSVPATGGFPFALSPDGQQLVYVSRCETGTELVTRRLDEFEFRPLPGTDGARQPFFSPNGETIGFFADGRLKSISIRGGQPSIIADISGAPRGASWGRNDTILLSLGGIGLQKVPASRGDPVPLLLDNNTGVLIHENGSLPLQPVSEIPSWPDILPDGKHALVSYWRTIGVISLSTGEFRRLREGSQGRYLSSGHILYSDPSGQVFRVLFDADELAITGPPMPVLDDVFQAPAGGGNLFAVSETGTLVYVRGGFDRVLTLLDRSGRRYPLTGEKRGYRWPRFDPKKNRLAFTVGPAPSDIWLLEMDQGSASRETTGRNHVLPTWSPDGRYLAFNSESSVYLWEVGNGSEPVLAGGVPENHYPLSWSPDGKVLALSKAGPETGLDIALLHLDEGLSEDQRYEPFLATPADESVPQFSPDGKWIAYTSNATGRNEVFVRPYPGSEPRYRISTDGGRDALWSSDGKELFYRKGDSVMAVRVEGETGLTASTSEVLFTGDFDLTQMLNWDVSENGRFAMIEEEIPATRQFQVVINWLQEIEAREDGGDGG